MSGTLLSNLDAPYICTRESWIENLTAACLLLVCPDF